MADLPLFVGRRDPASVVIPDSAFDFVQNITDGDRRATVGGRHRAGPVHRGK